ncbi:MAG: terminase small subunit [Clostridia bacterium]|nr:terminase small subunit [Clostridia bacterium]
MTPKQQRFCDYYLQTGNATEAAKMAGYSEKTARAIATENLTKPYIVEYLQQYAEKKRAEAIADVDEILSFWTTVMRGESFIFARLRASENLAKRYGLFDGAPPDPKEERERQERAERDEDILLALQNRQVEGFS